jgi:hypothetical protein
LNGESIEIDLQGGTEVLEFAPKTVSRVKLVGHPFGG